MEKKALYAAILSMLLALITQAPFIYGIYYFLSKMPDTSFITAVMYLMTIVLSPLLVATTLILCKIFYESIYGKEETEMEKYTLNNVDTVLNFIDTENKRTLSTLLGKSSKKYDSISLIYPDKNNIKRILSKKYGTVIQHLRTFTDDGNIIRMFITEYMKKVIKMKIEIYRDRDVKNHKGGHIDIIFKFEKPAISETGTELVNTVTVIIDKNNNAIIEDKDNRLFDYFMKSLYADKYVKFRDIPSTLLIEMFKAGSIEKTNNMIVNTTMK